MAQSASCQGGVGGSGGLAGLTGPLLSAEVSSREANPLHLQATLDKLQRTLHKHGLKINPKKTRIIEH